MTAQRLDVRFEIIWESNWHAGSGEGSAGMDRLVRRRMVNGRQIPFLPGSQLKGVLRHQCERLAATLGANVVSPHQIGSEVSSELLRQFQPLSESELPIDRLFGSRYDGDCLFVDDALPELQSTQRSWGQARTAIDRLTRTVRERTLFVTEVVSGQASKLQGRLRARHASGVLTCGQGEFPHEYALLLAGLLNIDSLGGDRSIGLGACRIEIPGQVVRWNDHERYPLTQALASFKEQEWYEMLKLVREGMKQS
jgi:CRISPR/Cas system CSM-associated protein Csm3 (group 7 of RAMP superfamily)